MEQLFRNDDEDTLRQRMSMLAGWAGYYNENLIMRQEYSTKTEVWEQLHNNQRVLFEEYKKCGLSPPVYLTSPKVLESSVMLSKALGGASTPAIESSLAAMAERKKRGRKPKNKQSEEADTDDVEPSNNLVTLL